MGAPGAPRGVLPDHRLRRRLAAPRRRWAGDGARADPGGRPVPGARHHDAGGRRGRRVRDDRDDDGDRNLRRRGDGPVDDHGPAGARGAADRADIALAVLNGTNTTGLAAQTAGQAEGLGYSGVTTGNAPTSTSPTIVYFRPGQRAAAQRVARDLQAGAVQQLPATGALADAAPDGAEVVVVLGPG